jgi:uncharacterized protein YaaQ
MFPVMIDPDVIDVATDRLVSVPMDVMFGCAAVCIVPVIVVAAREVDVIALLTDRLVRVPIDVMFGCAGVCITPFI